MRSMTLVLGFAALLAPVAANAAGLYIPDTGTTARSRGGAFVAAADDPLAILYNPAGMTAFRSSGDQLLFDITALQLSEKFSRTGIPADSTAGTSATNAPPPQIVPDILYVHHINDQFSVGGGLHAPTGARYKFKDSGPQRFTNGELYLIEASLGVSVAYRPIKMVAVGLSLETMINGVQQSFSLTNNVSPNPPTEAPTNDVHAKLNVQQTLNPTGILGIKVMPTDAMEFGFSYRPAVKLNMPGTLVAAPPNASNEKIHFHSDLPPILRLGARYVAPTFDAELDFVYEDWSVHKSDRVTADDGNFVNSGSTGLVRNWKAAYSVRAGSTFRITQKIEGMGGVYYETSAVPKETMDVGSYDAPKIGINLGGKFQVNNRFTVAANLSHTLMTAVTVDNGVQRQQSPFGPPLVDNTDLSVINNGKYSGDYDFFGISLLTKF